MVKKCCVFACRSESYGGCNISFHRFPKMKYCGKNSIHVKQKITKNSVVCSCHFQPSSFYNANSRRLLKLDAIPTISPVANPRFWRSKKHLFAQKELLTKQINSLKMSTTRNQRKSKPPNSPCAPVALKRIENSWILLLPDQLFENDSFSIITLPHPASGNPAKFCLNNKLKKIYEVVTFKEPYRSWFIGETVKSNGSINLVTPVNPLYLVLPRLRELCSSRAMPLEDLLSEKGFEKIIDYVHNLDCIGDIKGSPDMKAYKYNEEKTLSWLEGKVRQLAGLLRSKNIHVTSAAASVTFVSSNVCNQSVDEEFFLKYASGIISEYLESEIADQLEKLFDFKPDLIESVGKKRKSDTQPIMPSKKFKSETDEEISKHVLNDSNQSINDWKDITKQKPLTAKEKARQKAASGTKTISAFFSKK